MHTYSSDMFGKLISCIKCLKVLLSPASYCLHSMNFFLSKSCCWCFTLWHILSAFARKEGCHARSGSELFLPADLAREIAKKRAPIILNSKAVVLGWITIYLSTSSSLMVILWHWWIVVAHQRLNGICLRLQKWHLQSIFLSTGNIGITFSFQGWRITSTVTTVLGVFCHFSKICPQKCQLHHYIDQILHINWPKS